MSKILVVGESCMDIFIYGDTPRLSPEGPAPVFIPTNEKYNGGMAANVESNLQQFGIDVDMITNTESITKTRYVHESSNTLLLRVDEGDVVKRVDDSKLKNVDYWEYNMVVISDYNKGFLTEEDIAYLAYKHPNIICDTKKKLGDWCKDLKFIKLNRSEYENNKEFIQNNDWILEKLIVTLDKDGCMYNGKSYPTHKVEILDISGAGDTFVSAFAFNWIETSNVGKSIEYANNCSSQVVQQRGVSVVNPKKIK